MRNTFVWAVTFDLGDEEYFVVAPSCSRAFALAQRLAYHVAAQCSVYRKVEVMSVTKKLEVVMEGEDE